jgi:carbamoyltransferase
LSAPDRFYVGLATTWHDPAVAVVDSSGQVLFAEASERFLQVKGARGCAADVRETVRRIIDDYCDPRGAFVIAKSWSRRAAAALDVLYLLGLTNHERLPARRPVTSRLLGDRRTLLGSVWLQHTANRLSGGHFADVLARLGNRRVSFVTFPHHLAHAATACFTSPFERAACMIVDGQGEWGSITYYALVDGHIELIKRMRGAESLGLIYSFCTDLCGFRSEDNEQWKMMGLAPYGGPNALLQDAFRGLVRMNGLTFRYPGTRHVRAWVEEMRQWARPAGADVMAAADLAFAAQRFHGEVMDGLLRNFHAMGISDDLVLAGGCALNSSYNGRIVGRTGFERLHVPSAPADDGTALGAALLAWRRDHPGAGPNAPVRSPYLGSPLSGATLGRVATLGGVHGLRHLPGSVHLEAARLLAAGKVLGWCQGRAEFGPRALGNRSILADPRQADVKDRINSIVKLREEFRPFAPSVLDEFGEEYFEGYQVSPYMERALPVRQCARARVPGIVHVDGTGRLQSVRREWNERFYDLIRAFHALTGVPMLLNTSFNVIGKPIVHSVEDAIGVFYTTGLDALVLEDFLIEKAPLPD